MGCASASVEMSATAAAVMHLTSEYQARARPIGVATVRCKT